MISRPKHVVAALLLVLATALIVQYVRYWTELTPALAESSDFAGSYVAATLWRDGHAAEVYDAAATRRVLDSEGVPAGADHQRFENPPSALWLATAVSWLGPVDAYRAWSVAQLLLSLAALLLVARAAPWRRGTPLLFRVVPVAIALAWLPSALLFNESQWDGLSMLGVALAYRWWRRGAPGRGGLALGLLGTVAKPHLLVGVVAYLLGRRDWRALGGVVVGGAVTVVAALAAVGPSGIVAYTRFVTDPSVSPSPEMLSLTGLTSSWLGAGSFASVLTYFGDLAALALAAVLGRRSRAAPGRLEASLFGALALSLLLAPHVFSHDLVILAPAGLALFARLGSDERVAWPGRRSCALLGVFVLFDIAGRLDLGHYTASFPGRLVPLVLILAAGLGWVLGQGVPEEGVDRGAGPESLPVGGTGRGRRFAAARL